MKTMVIERFGEPEVFRKIDLPRPELAPGQVLIEVRATSVNAVDVLIRQAGPAFLAPAFPAVLHADVAGVVVEVAPDVTGFAPGDEVYGCAGGVPGMGGALAEFMAADARLLARKPQALSMAEAAAMPLVTLTAWEAIRERMPVTSGKKLLVHGGAGGVGHIAVQLASLAGAEVYATVSSQEKADLARRFGAREAILYRETASGEYVEKFTRGKGFEFVFDTVGGKNLENSFLAAGLNAQIATTVALGEFDLSLAHLKGLSIHVIFMLIPLLHDVGREHHGRVLEEAARLVDRGGLRPLVDSRRFSFEAVADAHRLMESGRHVGKIVLENEWRS